MAQFTVPIAAISLINPSLTESLKLPRQPRSINTIDIYWSNLSGNSKVNMWLQEGTPPHAIDDPGNFSLIAFQLPATGDKNQQPNHETLCRQVPQGLDTIILKVQPGTPGSSGTAAILTFED